MVNFVFLNFKGYGIRDMEVLSEFEYLKSKMIFNDNGIL